MTREKAKEILTTTLSKIPMGVCEADVDVALEIATVERERCAKIAETWYSPYGDMRDLEVKQAIAAAIRKAE